MVDPYLPPLVEFSFDAAESAVIDLALASEKPWVYVPASDVEAALLKSAKDKILSFHLQRHGWTCCYCRTNLKGAGPFMTDREHILPKGKPAYKQLSFALWNLAAACKRCNIQFKASGDKFLVNADDPNAFLASENYLFIHPNFDLWDDHLARLAIQVNSKNIVKIVRKGSAKAAYTYDFFNLEALLVDSFDAGQGGENEVLESAAVIALRQLAEDYGQ